jgi:hypothetical protein
MNEAQVKKPYKKLHDVGMTPNVDPILTRIHEAFWFK